MITIDTVTVKELAEIKNCSIRRINQLIHENKISAFEAKNPQNSLMQYLIPVTSLPEELQSKYYEKLKKESGLLPEKQTKKEEKRRKNAVCRPFESMTEKEREQIKQWTSLLEEWEEARSRFQKKTEADGLFLTKCRLERPELEISIDTLYRKYAAWKNGDLEGLVDKRGGWNRGQSAIPEKVFEAFLWFYLDQRKPPLSQCYQDAMEWAREFAPEEVSRIPSEQSFRRRVRKLDQAALTYAQEGEKALKDRCVPYIDRQYGELRANDIWVADNHTFDIQSVSEEGRTHRLYLTAFLDMKSGALTGWNITDNPNSQSTVLALRHGILRAGIPRLILFDNGSEFLTHDIGGRGHRTRRGREQEPLPPTILQRLGIEMRNAQVKNAKAKPIERMYYTVKNQFSKAAEGYCGGTILERPENLLKRIREGRLPSDGRIRTAFDQWADLLYNMEPYGGKEQKKYAGLSRQEVWNQSIQEAGQRTATKDELSLLLMRSTRYQKIKRNGVSIEIAGEKMWYLDYEHTHEHLGEEVYVRYDPSEPFTVRLYDRETDRYRFTWPLARELMIEVDCRDMEKLKTAQERTRYVEKAVKARARALTAGLTSEQRLSHLEILERRGRRNQARYTGFQSPTRIIPLWTREEAEELPEAVGESAVRVDNERVARNLMKWRNQE